ncbi:hypothetical protein PR202_gb04091 [Eleusine coracana subsp. coracana]|uniref:Uncharacterized protein n=1 Tax=Eleusine coracana subsp. coracana TaxID=191504 RepID=A0AAV5E171_ELECO|nr:hypothetical protein PR202_gb04091 [Eleusine coracana subsp. coracana]
MRPRMLAARSLRKAFVPPALLSDPSPGSLPPTRLAVHVNEAGSSCSAYITSGCRVYKIEINMDGDMLSKGKESLLIPDSAQVAVARQLCKSIDIYDQDIHLCSLRTSPSGPIATGGTDRTVTIYDPRRWAALSRWVGCSKYEITGLSFSSVDQSFIYVQGVDYEVADTDVVAGWCESGNIFIADVRPL